MSIAASLARCDCTAATICSDRLAAAGLSEIGVENAGDITSQKLAIASPPHWKQRY
jgi:hypothetical protein